MRSPRRRDTPRSSGRPGPHVPQPFATVARRRALRPAPPSLHQLGDLRLLVPRSTARTCSVGKVARGSVPICAGRSGVSDSRVCRTQRAPRPQRAAAASRARSQPPAAGRGPVLVGRSSPQLTASSAAGAQLCRESPTRRLQPPGRRGAMFGGRVDLTGQLAHHLDRPAGRRRRALGTNGDAGARGGRARAVTRQVETVRRDPSPLSCPPPAHGDGGEPPGCCTTVMSRSCQRAMLARLPAPGRRPDDLRSPHG